MNDGDHPVGRQDHTAVCISSSLTGQDQTVLLIIGGRDSHGHTLKDCWLFNFESITWTQVYKLYIVIIAPVCLGVFIRADGT